MSELSRLFLSHEALDAWIGEGRADIQGDQLHDRGTNLKFILREGVRFLSEVSGADDGHQLVGRVKSLEQLAVMGGEHMADSVILGDNAYQVQTGFVGEVEPVTTEVPTAQIPAAPSVPPAPDTQAQRQTILALQNFFLNHVK